MTKEIKSIHPKILKGEDGEEWEEYSMQLKAACDNGDVSLVTSLKKCVMKKVDNWENNVNDTTILWQI